MRRVGLYLVAFLCVVACASPSSKSAVDTGEGSAPLWESGGPHTHAAVTTVASDYTTGSFATISLDDWAIVDTRFVTSGDPVVASQPSGVYQLNRFTYDTMRRYIPGAWRSPVWETHLGDRSNPHDVAECGGALFVSLYGEDRLAMYGIEDGVRLGHVDLSAFADGDGQSPEASSMRVFGDRLYVGLQRMNRDDGWQSEGSVVVEVDCVELTVTRHWSVGANALLVGASMEEGLLVSHTAHEQHPAGLSRLRLPSGELEVLLETPGEHVTGLATHDDTALAISLAQDGMSYAVMCLDLEEPLVRSRESTSRYLTAVQGNDRGEAWVSAGPSWMDPTAASGLFVYDVATCALINDEPVEMSLHPFSVAFF